MVALRLVRSLERKSELSSYLCDGLQLIDYQFTCLPPRHRASSLRRRFSGIPGRSFVAFAAVLVWSFVDIGAVVLAIKQTSGVMQNIIENEISTSQKENDN